MIINPKFNKREGRPFDLAEVEPFHFIDLKEVLHTGVLPAGSATSSVFNGIDSVDEIGGLVRDNFDAYDSMKSVASSMSNSSNNGKTE